jgi:hypothetical protein
LPPVESLFAAFLGYNPIAELLGSSGVLQQPGVNAAVLTGKQFFPRLISGPFHNGLVVVFTAAAVMMVIGAAASWVNPGRTVDDSDDQALERLQHAPYPVRRVLASRVCLRCGGQGSASFFDSRLDAVDGASTVAGNHRSGDVACRGRRQEHG